jgi:hypothetical protein
LKIIPSIEIPPEFRDLFQSPNLYEASNVSSKAIPIRHDKYNLFQIDGYLGSQIPFRGLISKPKFVRGTCVVLHGMASNPERCFDAVNPYDFSDYGIRFNDTTFAFFIEGILIPKEEARALEDKLGIALQLRGQDFTSEQYRAIKSKSPEIYREIIEIGLSCNCFAAEPSIDNLVLSYVELDQGGEQSLSSYALEEIISSAQNALWYFNKCDTIKEAVSRIKEKRLLEIMQIDKTRRIHDDLSRTFFRALTELRKHQEWRRRLLIIDIPSQDGDGSKRLEE